MNDTKEELDAEELRLRRLNALRGIAQIIARRWLWAFLAALVVVSGALTALLARRTARSCERAVVTTKLQFYPKSAAKIPALDAKQVLQILTRAALVRTYIEEAGLVGVERLRAWIDLSIEQNRWDPRLFEITTKASTEARAVEKANAFADVCLKEYEAYRRAELEKWLTTIGARRQELTDQIAQVDGEEQRLAQANGLLSPEEDADRLRTTISDQKVRLSEAAVRVTNGALRAKRLKEELGAVSVKAFGRADELKALQEDVLRAEKEVARLRTLYTDKNPRLAVVLKAQAESRAKLDAFLKENEMPAMTSVELERLTAVYEKLKDTEIEYEVQKSGKEALEKEIAANERQLTTLVRLLPQFEGFRRRRETLQATIQGLEETISDIRYLQASVSGDLAQVEHATGGKVASPLSKKNVALGLAGGLFAAGGLLTLLVLLDFAFGRVRSPREVACYLGVRLLGAVGCECFPLRCRPTGQYRDVPTLGHMNVVYLQQSVRKRDADLGVALSGSGAEMVVVDETGEAVSPLRLSAAVSPSPAPACPRRDVFRDVLLLLMRLVFAVGQSVSEVCRAVPAPLPCADVIQVPEAAERWGAAVPECRSD